MGEQIYEKQVHMWRHLLASAESELGQAEETVREGGNEFRAAFQPIVFCAFTIEAVLNHIGFEHVPSYRLLEEGLSYARKYDLVCEYIGASIDKGQRPGETLTELRKVRNEVAHGKEVRIPTRSLDPGSEEYDLTPLEERATLEKARIAVKDTKAIVEQLVDCANERMRRYQEIVDGRVGDLGGMRVPEHIGWAIESGRS